MTKSVHTTNTSNAFIGVAADCPASSGQIPPERSGKPTVATLQYTMIRNGPYKYTSDDVVFATSVAGRALGVEAKQAERQKAREQFFSRGQACLRASALGKAFGWGVHSDAGGRVAIFAVDSSEYRRLAADPGIKQVKAMRSKRG
jgi:predicted phage gp36 major capsid-like protein